MRLTNIHIKTIHEKLRIIQTKKYGKNEKSFKGKMYQRAKQAIEKLESNLKYVTEVLFKKDIPQ